ncbi:hypothetical protein G9464_07120 [Halostella sp. JP-L12]|uniref:DUF7321 family protein n=1 Tax=Halostella TaxID=1843185 RepID=UPI000EF7EB2A|nr:MULTISPECIES: hypothetical protein [Halostella]NHN47365.1 hypothetical protein [Halostella sp. JP-L12]
MASETVLATTAAALVTLSFPFYLYGAWVMIDAEEEEVTWDLLVYHLKFIVVGLLLTTVPVAVWMFPRLWDQLGGFAAAHAFFGLQAYAMLTFALTGIVRILQAKRKHDLYSDPDQDVSLSDLHENADAWRRRLRVGVFGYVAFWVLAYALGIARYVIKYQIF